MIESVYGSGKGKTRRVQQTARFAPSPTGTLHLGNARTALFNWLLVRHEGGRWCCGSRTPILNAPSPSTLRRSWTRSAGSAWTGTKALSSRDRTTSVREVVQSLLGAGLAYRSTATRDDVQAWKDEHGSASGFRGQPETDGAIRLHVPAGKTVVHDIVHGESVFENEHLDDFVIARADGTPLYNLAATIDDMDAGISHVVRGDGHLSNTPRQLLIWEACRSAGLTKAEPPSTPISPLLTVRTASRSLSVKGRRRFRICATLATCPRPCVTTSRCSAGDLAKARQS